jgi:hypothetical protein
MLGMMRLSWHVRREPRAFSTAMRLSSSDEKLSTIMRTFSHREGHREGNFSKKSSQEMNSCLLPIFLVSDCAIRLTGLASGSLYSLNSNSISSQPFLARS